jgi:hypothetical protein
MTILISRDEAARLIAERSSGTKLQRLKRWLTAQIEPVPELTDEATLDDDLKLLVRSPRRLTND